MKLDVKPHKHRHKNKALSTTGNGDHPLMELQRGVDELFDDFWSDFGSPFTWPAPWGGFGTDQQKLVPAIDVEESDDDIQIKADLPGMKEENIHVTLDNDLLTIKGEKEEKKSEKKKDYRISERSFGRVERSLRLPPGLDHEKCLAKFKNGVLSIKLPKTPEAKSNKKQIEVEKG